jgi:lysophospholipase L1-like esterase
MFIRKYYIKFFILFMFWGPVVLVAQSGDSTEIPSFINWDENKLFRDSDTPLDNFFSSLDSLIMRGDRKINILQIGDSHIQAGFLSNEIRIQFQNNMLLGNGGRGLIFPYKIAHTNGPWNYGIDYTGHWEYCKNINRRVPCNCGLTGYTAISRDTNSTITVYANHKADNPYYGITRVKVLHRTDEHSFHPVLYDVKIIEENQYEGYTEFILLEETDVITLGFKQTDSRQNRIELYGITLETEDPGIVFNSVGVNSADCKAFLRCGLLEQQLQILDPTLVIVSLGTNDAYSKVFDKQEFKDNYAELFARIRKGAPNCSIILTTPGDNYRYRKYYNFNNVGAREAIFELAKEENLSVWDFFTVMGGPNSIYDWYKSGLASADKIHFTQAGYELTGMLLYEAIMQAYYEHLDKLEENN